jgi:hypothetical protein
LVAVAPSIGWRSGRRQFLSPSIGLAVLRASTSTISVASGGAASFVWTVGQLDGCLLSWPSAGAARMLGCVRIDAGALEAVGSRIQAARSSTRGWFAMGPLARAEWDLLPPLFAATNAAMMVHFTTDRFYFLPENTTIYAVPTFGFEFSAGLGVRFL